VARARNLIAQLAAGDYASANDATDLMIRVNAITLKLDRAGEVEIANMLMSEKSAAVGAGEAARSKRLDAEISQAREAHREAERTRPDAWMRHGGQS
jgi:hypothetical protein